MKYKCDTCQYRLEEAPCDELPYPNQRCTQGKWNGVGDGPEPAQDPWRDCKEFKSDGRPRTYTVIGIYEDNHQRFASVYEATSAEDAEWQCCTENPGVLVAATIEGNVEVAL